MPCLDHLCWNDLLTPEAHDTSMKAALHDTPVLQFLLPLSFLPYLTLLEITACISISRHFAPCLSPLIIEPPIFLCPIRIAALALRAYFHLSLVEQTARLTILSMRTL